MTIAVNHTNSFLAQCHNRRTLMFRFTKFQAAVCQDIVVYQFASDLVQLVGQDPTCITYPVERVYVSSKYVATSSSVSTDIFTVRRGWLVRF